MRALRRVPNPLKDRRISIGASYARLQTSSVAFLPKLVQKSMGKKMTWKMAFLNLKHLLMLRQKKITLLRMKLKMDWFLIPNYLVMRMMLKKLVQLNWNCQRLRLFPVIIGHPQGGLPQNCSKLLSLLQVFLFIRFLISGLRKEKILAELRFQPQCSIFVSARMYGRALQLSEWLEANKQLDFIERDYASRLDLIAKVHGLQKAENYIQKVPKSFRGEVVYRTFLANCVVANSLKKAEEVFNKMKDLEFPITSFACNQLLLLYKRLDKKKIADVLLLMEKENVKPSLFTYKILIDAKGLSNDITGMDQIVETMKAEGIEPDIHIKSIQAKHYVSGGLMEKAQEVVKVMEGDNIKENRWACRFLLPLYAQLGKADEVGRIWKVCESNPRLEECLAAIEAWGKLGKIEEAEAVFDRMLKTSKKLSARYYTPLLKVYSNHKMLQKGKDLVKRMADNGYQIGPLTWDALVKLYVEAGEVEKADSILQKASQQKQVKPLFSSFMTVMEQYSKRGDIHNSEKMLHRMRQAGYVARLRQFQSLVQAYINAKTPAYGIRERMKADNIFPNKALASQLAQVDPFRRTAVSDLLD